MIQDAEENELTKITNRKQANNNYFLLILDVLHFGQMD
jgi:hypothetical protein